MTTPEIEELKSLVEQKYGKILATTTDFEEFSLYLEKNAQEPASSASDSIQPNDNKVIDYQLWDK